MIIVDTNVISESLKPRCSEAVTAWLDAQVAESLFVTSINAAELWAGLALMPEGARKNALEESLDDLLERLFGRRQLSFDFKAARAYADVTRRGKPLPLADGLIAAIAHVHGFAVATRDEGPFREAGVKVINPWEYAGTG